MVPSWTETLLECGVNVVGRTRFCIHPGACKRVSPVGGTKDIDWQKVQELKPDLLILDREENPKFMYDEAPCETLVTHVTSVVDVAPSLESFATRLPEYPKLIDLAQRWKTIVQMPPLGLNQWSDFDPILEWIEKPSSVSTPDKTKIIYVIWRNPWMAVGSGTFIASMLERLGFRDNQIWPSVDSGTPSKYPEFRMEEAPENGVFLFSTEPFPFRKKISELASLKRPSALIDGESMSWFGLRSLEFLESRLGRR